MRWLVVVCWLVAGACHPGSADSEAGGAPDGGAPDGGTPDGGGLDAGDAADFGFGPEPDYAGLPPFEVPKFVAQPQAGLRLPLSQLVDFTSFFLPGGRVLRGYVVGPDPYAGFVDLADGEPPVPLMFGGASAIDEIRFLEGKQGTAWVAWRQRALEQPPSVWVAPIDELRAMGPRPGPVPALLEGDLRGVVELPNAGDADLILGLVVSDGVVTVLEEWHLQGPAWGLVSTTALPVGEVGCGPGCRRLTPFAGPPAMAGGRAWSGAWLAAVAQDAADGSERVRIWGRPAEGGAWAELGGGVRTSEDTQLDQVVAATVEGRPWVGWRERRDEASWAYAARFDEQTAAWQPLAPGLAETEGGWTRDLALQATPGAGLLLTYLETNGPLRVLRHRRYDDESGRVLPVGQDQPVTDHAQVLAVQTAVSAEDLRVSWLVQVAPDELLHETLRAEVVARGWDVERARVRGPLRRRPMTGCFLADQPPAEGSRLSETGCYASTNQRRIADFGIPYELNASLWADDLRKRRFIMLPEGALPLLQGQGLGGTFEPALLPVGGVVVKEFWLGDPRVGSSYLVETRFLTRLRDGTLRGYTYQWDANQGDARLVPDAEVTIDLPVRPDLGFAAGRRHTFPARTGRQGCSRCHGISTDRGLAGDRLLGFNPANLQRIVQYPEGPDHQLWALVQARVLRLQVDPDAVVAQVDPAHRGAGAEPRALSYFQANCVHCHGRGGERRDLEFGPPDVGRERLLSGLCRHVRPYESRIVSRVWQVDQREDRFGLIMPPLGSKIADPLNAEILADWIERGPNLCQR